MTAPAPGLPGVADVVAAHERIRPWVRRTPIVRSRVASRATGFDVFLKLESQQLTGSFKARGAFNAILALDPDRRSRGVVCASTGNHGKAVSAAATSVGCRAVVCVPDSTPAHRRRAIERFGGELRVCAGDQDAAIAEAVRIAEADGLTFVHPFDDPAVIAGQGTIALELLEAIPDLGAVIVPVSGGGLVSGIGLAMRALAPRVRVVGVSARATPAMARSVAAGHPVSPPELPTIADNLAGGIGPDNRYTLRIASACVDAWPEVSEAALRRALHELHVEDGVPAEGAGAATVAALLDGLVDPCDGPVVAVISGGNREPRRTPKGDDR